MPFPQHPPNPTQRETARGTGSQELRALSPCVIDGQAPDRDAPSGVSGHSADQHDHMGGRPVPPTYRPPHLFAVDDRLAPDPGPGLARLYERHIVGALRAVSAEQRECIELTYFDGLDAGEVAARRASSPAAVEAALGEGLRAMLCYLRACARREARAERAAARDFGPIMTT